MGHRDLWPSPKFQTMHMDICLVWLPPLLFKKREKEKEIIHKAEYLHTVEYLQCLLSPSASLYYANKKVCASK